MADTRFVYSITATPNPIRVSIGGDHPKDSKVDDHHKDSQVDLLVMINNRGQSKAVDTITIKIPIGADDYYALSSASKFPKLIKDGNDQWNIVFGDDDASTIVITPVDSTDNLLSKAIMFTLPGILVNQTVGNVPITVSDISPGRTDSLPPLVKLRNDFAVTRFYAEKDGEVLNPPVLSDQDQTVLLKWECTTVGESLSYKLCSKKGDAFQPTDDYSWQDGRSGVTSVKLTQDTTFELQMLKAGVQQGTLSLTVLIDKPAVTTYKIRPEDRYFKGRVIRLRWVANSAATCAVEVDSQTVEDNAPTDTHDQGFLVPIAGGVRSVKPYVTAFARVGDITKSEPFDSINVVALDTIGTDTPMQNLAITPDGAHGLGNNGGNNVTVIDVASKTSRSVWAGGEFNSLDPHTSKMAFAPNGAFAVVPCVDGGKNWTGPRVFHWMALKIDVRGGAQGYQVLYDIPELTGYPLYVAITPDQKYALTSDAAKGLITVLNLQSSQVEQCVWYQSSTRPIAVTPDGQLALIGVNGGIVVMPLSQPASAWALEPNPIAMPFAYAQAIAISSDSKIALVAHGSAQGRVTVVDIPGRRTLPYIGFGANSIALTTPHDASPELAVITSQDGSLTVLRMDDLQGKPVKIPLDPGYEPGEIVISKTGGLNNHGVGLIATNKNHVIRFDVDELPWRPKSAS